MAGLALPPNPAFAFILLVPLDQITSGTGPPAQVRQQVTKMAGKETGKRGRKIIKRPAFASCMNPLDRGGITG
ncbi:MAG: hypothetical protein C4531_01675 [Desulfurivibrio sp.]|nr:MAG: hypothetical protein C4531_01675 [Desulfurivibrio sp.]